MFPWEAHSLGSTFKPQCDSHNTRSGRHWFSSTESQSSWMPDYHPCNISVLGSIVSAMCRVEYKTNPQSNDLSGELEKTLM